MSEPHALPPEERRGAEIDAVRLVVGLEIHVELATRRKMFAAAPSPGVAEFAGCAPNTCLDPTVLALPGSLPVMNRHAIELSVRVGLALGCRIAERPVWDRKGYVYPDLPKAYQLSQYDLPLCFDGALDLPPVTHDGAADHSGDAFDPERHSTDDARIRIRRAHLEEDAGKLLHEAPGGRPIGYSIVDLNRAGTPLLEIVTEPDFTTGAQAEGFCRELRRLCRHVGATEGDMQKGHVRFEPNINCELTLGGAHRGRVVRTPITEVKNLNSFRAVRGAIEHELRHQPGRWREDGRELGPATKTTRGWDDTRLATFVQREKEDEQDYRYFPDPDLPPARIGRAWVESVRAGLPERPMAAMRRAVGDYQLSAREAETLVDEPAVARYFEAAVDAAVEGGLSRSVAGLRAGKLLLQSGRRRANERADAGDADVTIADLGILPGQVAELVLLREADEISADAADELFGILCEPDAPERSGDAGSVRSLAETRGLLIVRDTGALDAWCQQAIDEQPKIAADVRAGKLQAVGRLIGAVRQLSGGAADAKAVRQRLLEILGTG